MPFIWNESADQALEYASDFTDIEKRFRKKTHSLKDYLGNLEYVIFHLNDWIPDTFEDLHYILFDLTTKIEEMREYANQFNDHVITVERKDSDKIEVDIQRSDVFWEELEPKLKIEIINIEFEMLENLHGSLNDMLKVVPKKKVKVSKEQTHFEDRINHYLYHFLTFFEEYEKINRKLLKKARKDVDKMEKAIEKS